MSTEVSSLVHCTWCGQTNNIATVTNCTTCGGPLPIPPSKGLVEEPPPAPRILPADYHKKRLNGDVGVLIGKIFVFAFFWTLIFPIIGYFLWKNGKEKILKKLKALEEGTAVIGKVIDVYKDTSVTMNGRNPWAMEYSFETKTGQTESGTTSSWDPSISEFSTNDKIWIVYIPKDPSMNSIWPPIKK